MATHKPKRGAPTIDMTAMVDVAFLLLTFFILTTSKFREDQSVEVDTPSSISDLQPPEEGLMTISVDSEGRVFAGFSDIDTRTEALNRVISEKQYEINEEGFGHFSTLLDFGVSFEENEFEKWLNMPHSERKDYVQQGMRATPTDTLTGVGNDLKDWVRIGRLSDQRMRFAIKGDIDAPYKSIKNVINSLQEWDVNQFVLVTELEEGGIVELEEKKE